MHRFAMPVLGLFALLAVACASEQPSTPPPAPDIEATVTAMVEALPTKAPPSTLAALPTYTPPPPATPYPTPEPLPTYTPQPTLESLPTHTPYPTPEPQPTLVPLPTYTPQPAPAPVVRTVVERDNWMPDSLGYYTVIGNSPRRGAWLLSVTCFEDGDLGVWLWHALGRVFGSGASGDQSLLADFDGDSQEQTWVYIAADEDDDDFFSANWPRNVIEKLLESEKAVFTIPTSGQSYVVTFDVAGLDQHIKKPENLCG